MKKYIRIAGKLVGFLNLRLLNKSLRGLLLDLEHQTCHLTPTLETGKE
jgi:hypothetical protein